LTKQESSGGGVNSSATFLPDGTQINPDFGQYNGAASARKMVLALKLKF
jgi:hypothetical protein